MGSSGIRSKQRQRDNTAYVWTGDKIHSENVELDISNYGKGRIYPFTGPVSITWYPIENKLDSYDIVAYHLDKDTHNLDLIIKIMASGIPLLIDRTSITNKIIAHGINGILCNTVEDFNYHLEYLKNDPVTRQELGQAARAWAGRYING